MTQTERNDLARALGITPEACPQVWECGFCLDSVSRCEWPGNDKHVWHCTLPDPEGDDPGVWLWDGAFMRALDKAGLDPQVVIGGQETCVVTGLHAQERHFFKPETTAALLAAWRATR